MDDFGGLSWCWVGWSRSGRSKRTTVRFGHAARVAASSASQSTRNVKFVAGRTRSTHPTPHSPNATFPIRTHPRRHRRRRRLTENQKLSPEDRAFVNKYGRLPPKKPTGAAWLSKTHKATTERKYFDSGDYALSKVGRVAGSEVGQQHPSPEKIPHSTPQGLEVAGAVGSGAHLSSKSPVSTVSKSPGRESHLKNLTQLDDEAS